MDTVEIEVPTQAEQLRALVDMWKRRRWGDMPAAGRGLGLDAFMLEQCIMELEERL